DDNPQEDKEQGESKRVTPWNQAPEEPKAQRRPRPTAQVSPLRRQEGSGGESVHPVNVDAGFGAVNGAICKTGRVPADPVPTLESPPMKLLHIADIHLDRVFHRAESRPAAVRRRGELRDALTRAL